MATKKPKSVPLSDDQIRQFIGHVPCAPDTKISQEHEAPDLPLSRDYTVCIIPAKNRAADVERGCTQRGYDDF